MGDKVIQFPGAAGRQPPEPNKDPSKDPNKSRRTTGATGKTAKNADKAKPDGAQVVDPATLSEDQKKALQIVLSGMPFVAVGIKPTGGGADFFTAVHGEAADLRNAGPHLAGVIERAFGRKGI